METLERLAILAERFAKSTPLFAWLPSCSNHYRRLGLIGDRVDR